MSFFYNALIVLGISLSVLTANADNDSLQLLEKKAEGVTHVPIFIDDELSDSQKMKALQNIIKADLDFGIRGFTRVYIDNSVPIKRVMTGYANIYHSSPPFLIKFLFGNMLSLGAQIELARKQAEEVTGVSISTTGGNSEKATLQALHTLISSGVSLAGKGYDAIILDYWPRWGQSNEGKVRWINTAKLKAAYSQSKACEAVMDALK